MYSTMTVLQNFPINIPLYFIRDEIQLTLPPCILHRPAILAMNSLLDKIIIMYVSKWNSSKIYSGMQTTFCWSWSLLQIEMHLILGLMRLPFVSRCELETFVYFFAPALLLARPPPVLTRL